MLADMQQVVQPFTAEASGRRRTLHRVKDGTLGKDASQTHGRHGADILAMLHTTVISLLRRAGIWTIAARPRHNSQRPHVALALPDITIEENA